MDYNEYHRMYNKTRYDERIKLAREKLGNKCNFCESIENLHIDHIAVVDKKYDIHYATRLSMDKFLEEVNKCQLLCDKCHVFKTNVTERGRYIPHGGGLQGRRGCSCEPCKIKKKEYMKNYSANHIRKRDRK